ncbi:MAG: hypothetical protein QOG69_1597 [Actinomycetota bacterium]|nr:hypothetical protein [Actinomycetota bacterium]
MRGKQQPADEPYDSPFAMTILPGKAARTSKDRRPAKSRKPEAAAEFTPAPAGVTPATFAAAPLAPAEFASSAPQPVSAHAVASAAAGPVAASYALDYPAAPGFPLQPHYAGGHIGGDLLPSAGPQPGHGTPGVPPAGYAPLNFLDDHDAPEPQGKKSRTPILIAAALVVALAAGGFYEVPKLLKGKKSTATTAAMVLPAKIGTLAKQPNNASTTIAATLAAVRKADPALVNAQVGVYGPDAAIVVIATSLPKSVTVTGPEQVLLSRRINAALPPVTAGATRKLAAVPQAADAGQFSCAVVPAATSTPASTDCIAVDSQAVIVIIVRGANEQANVRRATTVRGLVEHP